MPNLEPFDLGVLKPVKPYPRIWRRVLRWLQRKCRHKAMKADILEGCHPYYSVRWCETCGAVWLAIDGSPCGMPRMPEPTWES
jgi:hypothetical protein